MKITAVTPHLLTTPWTDDPWFPQALHSTALVRIETDSKLDGLGEITLGYFAGESVPPLVEFLKPALLGRDPMDTLGLANEMLAQCIWWGRAGMARSVLSGIELALWDLKGKALGVPVYQLLGGKTRDKIPVYASGGPALWPTDKNLRKVADYSKWGYRATKLSPDFFEMKRGSGKKGQGRLQWVTFPHSKKIKELTRSFDKIRHEFPDFDLLIDGHQGAEPNPIAVTEAIEIAEALTPYRIRFYEEPLAFTNLEGYRDLTRRSRIPIAVGESFSGLDQFHAFITNQALHVVQPDIGFVGGIHETLRIIHHAEAHNVTTAIHTGASMGPSLAASWHVAAACRSVEWLEQVPAARSIQNDLLLDRFEVKDGFVGMPAAPGLGVRLTTKHLAKYKFVPNSGERT